MFYFIIGFSLFFIGMAFVITEKNAKYILAGYNTMPVAERKKFKLKKFIHFYKRFHIGLGTSMLILGLLLYYSINETASIVFVTVYPIVAYVYLLVMSIRIHGGSYKKQNKVGLAVLILTIILVVGLFMWGSRASKLEIESSGIKISGMYGETIPFSEIAKVETVENIPTIVLRTNGFSLGTVQKGYFRTANGESIKLFLNSAQKPYVLVVKANGSKLYYGANTAENKHIYEELSKVMP